jgi:hypothetical protein
MASNTINQEIVSQTDFLITQKKKKDRHKRGYFNLYYQKNKQKYSLANQKYRLKKQANKPIKSASFFQINREKNFLTCLNKHHVIVPVPRFLKIKHPIIKN